MFTKLILTLALVLVWHSEVYYARSGVVKKLNELSANTSVKDIKVTATSDWFYIFWETEEN